MVYKEMNVGLKDCDLFKIMSISKTLQFKDCNMQALQAKKIQLIHGELEVKRLHAKKCIAFYVCAKLLEYWLSVELYTEYDHTLFFVWLRVTMKLLFVR